MKTLQDDERERCAQIVREEWHRAVTEFRLLPGSPTEAVTARILSRLYGEKLSTAYEAEPE